MIEVMGWISSFVLLLTLVKQVHKQWQAKTSKGLSKWLFVGQLIASVGFVVYSYFVGNWVFTITNGLLVINNMVGIYLYYKYLSRGA
jgi:uncharacterized protein with PQ loop repeat